jgi:hypothetical protein
MPGGVGTAFVTPEGCGTGLAVRRGRCGGFWGSELGENGGESRATMQW